MDCMGFGSDSGNNDHPFSLLINFRGFVLLLPLRNNRPAAQAPFPEKGCQMWQRFARRPEIVVHCESGSTSCVTFFRPSHVSRLGPNEEMRDLFPCLRCEPVTCRGCRE